MTTSAPTIAGAGVEVRVIPVWQEQIRLRVQSKGSGSALVFFHGPWGLAWDPFLDDLARHFTVYAPEHPGTGPETPDDAAKLDSLWDLVLCYDEMLEALGIENAMFVGHSFGGMVAAEIAAAYPRRAKKLALIAPLGFWRDADRIKNWMMLNPADIPAQVFADPKSAGAQLLFGTPGSSDPDARVRMMWAMGATGKFIWPLPDKGLKKRIHRVKAPTLVIWGADDRLVPPVYAEEFTKRMPGARAELVAGAGHAPQLDEPETLARMVRELVG